MNLLLKIVSGPMRGAEIALVPGLCLSVGSSEECDVVVADGAMADKAFSLDVSEEGVTLTSPGSAPANIAMYEVFTFGSTDFAYGSADEKWPELIYKKEEDAAKVEEETEEQPSPPIEPSSPQEEAKKGKEESTEPKKKSHLFAILLLIFFLIILALLAWLFYARKEKKVEIISEDDKPAFSLQEIASKYNLTLESGEKGDLILGNLQTKKERKELYALVRQNYPKTKLKVTDDETLKASVVELLFGITEGAVQVESLKDGVLTLKGSIKDLDTFTLAMRTIENDIPGIKLVNPQNVQITSLPTGAPITTTTSPRVVAKTPKKEFPIAGIVTKPYTYIVLKNGTRLVEGAEFGGVVIEKIEANKVTLRDGNNTYTVEP